MTLRADADTGAELEQSSSAPPDLLPMQESDDTSGATPASRPRRRRLTKRARFVLIGALVLLLAGAGVGTWAVFFRTPAAQTTYRTVTIAQETLTQSVSASGTLNPATESDLSFASSGTVTAVQVAAGDLVTKGRKLATIDDSELKINLTSAKASRTEAEDSLATLEDDDSSTATAIAAAKANVEVKKNAVTQARTALKAATLTSPITGKVAEVTIAKGDTVSGGSSTSGSNGSSTGSSGSTSGSGTSGSSAASSSSASPAITVISNGTFIVTTSVSNADVTSIKRGLQATITPTGSTQPVFGVVSSVGVVATSSSSSASSGSATFPVTIKVTGTQKSLLPGSSATVAITVKQLSNVIGLPTQAVSTVNGKTVVQKLVNGKQVPTDVTLGATVGATTVVTSGLKVGDQVVLASFRITGATGTGGQTNRGGFGGTGGGFTGQGGGGFTGQGGGGFTGQRGTGGGQGTGFLTPTGTASR